MHTALEMTTLIREEAVLGIMDNLGQLEINVSVSNQSKTQTVCVFSSLMENMSERKWGSHINHLWVIM